MTHTEKAKDLFARKFHCSQAVFAAFSEELGLTEEQALKIGACFGSGMRKGEVCGACTGALMALGLKYGQADEKDLESRLKTNEVTDQFLNEFKKENGSYLCKDLLGCDLATEEGVTEAIEKKLFTEFCPKMVESATRIAEKILNMNIKLVIFDFDGTIADTRKAIIVAKQETMKKLGLRIADDEECASTIGLSSKSGFQKSYPELSEEMLDKCVVIYREFFEEKRLVYPPVLFPGIIEVLEALNEKGIVCTIATSRNGKSCREFLEQLGIAKYFSYVLCAEDTTQLKPNPEPVLRTLEDLSFSPQETLVVGDMPMDIQMAKGAGVYACGVTYGNATKEDLLAAGADFTVDDIRELQEFLFGESF